MYIICLYITVYKYIIYEIIIYMFLSKSLFIRPIVISNTFKFELEKLLRIGRYTILRHIKHIVKNLTAVKVNVLLMKNSP